MVMHACMILINKTYAKNKWEYVVSNKVQINILIYFVCIRW